MSKDNKPIKKHKNVRRLEGKAIKGDINALFQLAEYYEQGELVEKNTELAEAYFQKTLDKFKSQSLRVATLTLVDFRIFKNIKIDFSNKVDSNLTVIVGDNGAGKTAILESIEKSLSWLVRSITSNGGTGDFIKQEDINNNENSDYASILTKFSITDNTKYELELSKTKEGRKSSRKGHYREIKQLAEIYKLANSKDVKFNYPIMVSYLVDRALDIKKRDTLPFDEVSERSGWDKFDGYDKGLNGAADFRLFFRWFKYLDDLNNSMGDKENLDIIDRLQAELDSEFLQAIEKKSMSEGRVDELLESYKQLKKNEIKKLKAEFNKGNELQPGKVILNVTEAIYEFMPGFNSLRIQRSPLDLLINKNNITLSILQLSQGEKSLLALVADIARRLVLLNPSLKRPLEGSGVVLIDEVDLHLHPAWQQSILPNLTKTFPNIQFIVTTHSPQVLTTVHNSCIRVLTPDGVCNVSVGTLGEESRVTLEDVMHVDSRPVDSMAEQLKQYLEIINRGDIDSQEVKSLRKELEVHYGKGYSQLRLADIAINRWLAVRKNKNNDIQ